MSARIVGPSCYIGLKTNGFVHIRLGYLSGQPGRGFSSPLAGCNMRKKSSYFRTSSSLNMAVRGGLTRFARPCGAARSLRLRSVQLATPVVDPRSGILIPPGGMQYAKKSSYFRTSSSLNMAVRGGFEPPIRCRIHTFQACSFSHSDTSPYCFAAHLGWATGRYYRELR